ncbi:hypothetical protein PISMIDRAFT_504017 [Pisolithus microcarpus 441]|uniref:Uncharacterized protein n=1 Tax=Pisolithus microcarpus 441 TaxID=765257 RepID=A0A0C9YZV2_9AGAM|nr:hypothetical protein PISMIDRAFT_504017 [Pisolithus microcarpus 441]
MLEHPRLPTATFQLRRFRISESDLGVPAFGGEVYTVWPVALSGDLTYQSNASSNVPLQDCSASSIPMIRAHQDESDPSGKCYFFEIVQFCCEMQENQQGGVTPHCFPTPRLFKKCPEHPAVEITKITQINMQTGEIVVPDGNILPRGKPWHGVHIHGRG